jgi:thiosulfate/3-mercaptopyruvate sulfurtransferase
MSFTTLVSTADLAAHAADTAVAIVDCRFVLDDVDWGARAYREGHIPGAVYAHLDRDLSGTRNGRNGRHPLPDSAVLAATLGRLGIDDKTQVIAYDQDAGMYASRLWWLLRWVGHEAVAVLDGGFAKWTAEKRPTVAGEEHRPPRTFIARPDNRMLVTVDRIAAMTADPEWRLVDARAPERFRGEQETIDRVAGHIPGAANHFFKTNLTGETTFKLPDQLRAAFGDVIGRTSPDHVIMYCGSGVTACHNLLALEHAGIRGAKLYPGSWSEWSSDPDRPIETGDR